jgi:tetratricopeptide (TPR) repeat protein
MQNNNSQKLVSNKFALIYEFNKNSPLFARVAADFYNNGNYDTALEILEDGIKLFPEYPTAYFIYSKVFAATGNIEKAKEMVVNGSKILDSEDTKLYYLNQIDNISSSNNRFKESKRASFLDDQELPSDTEAKKNINDIDRSGQDIEYRLDELAAELNKAKIDISDSSQEENEQSETDHSKEEIEDDDESFYGKQFISETLAGIYLTQKNYRAARNIYQKLIEVEPDKKDFFENKIKEISRIIENMKE